MPENSICHEIDTGKHYYLANGEWHQLPARGGEGGGLPADFPAEGSENANKFLGFDANGDYTAKDAPSGGGAEKFVVTLTQDAQTEEWTADKTIAEIVAADAAGKIVVAKYPTNGMNIDIPLNMAMEYQGMYGATFAGLATSENNNKVVAVRCMDEGSGAAITIVEQQIPTSTNAPLIVTMQNGVGNKTLAEIHAAANGGRTVVFAGNIDGSGFVLYCTSTAVFVKGGNTVYQAYYFEGGTTGHFEGGASDYPSFS